MHNLFYENPDLYDVKTVVIDFFSVDNKNYIVIEDNIFYPQGGGQKGDRGVLLFDLSINVINCVKSFDSRYKSLLIVDNFFGLSVGMEVCAKIDVEFRKKQMCFHSALHIHHLILEDLFGSIPNPIMSNIEADGAVNKYDFLISEDVFNESLIKFNEFISNNYEIITYAEKFDPNFRYWECNKRVIPCGGLHVSNTSMLNNLNFIYSTKKGSSTIKISF